MQIERIYYPIETLGFGKRIGIWTVGCPHGCKGCSNPELWSSNERKELLLQDVYKMLTSVNGPIDGVTITGGEPFLQTKDLANLVEYIHKELTEDILIYSGFTYKELLEMSITNSNIKKVLKSISCLIDGKYIEDQNDNLPLRGSSNQQIHILNNKFNDRYMVEGDRKQQHVFVNNHLLAFGIPNRNGEENLRKGLKKYGVSFD